MGNFISEIWYNLYGIQKIDCIMFSLDIDELLHIHQKILYDKYGMMMPFINRMIFNYNNLTVTYFKFPTTDKIKKLIRYYFVNRLGLIFVVDSSNDNKINDSYIQIQALLEEEGFRDSIILIFSVNKNDQQSVKPNELSNRLKLNTLSDREWKIQVIDNESNGIYDGLNWLEEAINKKFK